VGGRAGPGQTVLVLGATGTSGRIATQLATRRGARVVAALTRMDPRAADAPGRIRYIQVGIGAGEVATLPAMTLRSAPVQLFGSGIGGQADLGDAAAAYGDLLRQVAAGEISLDVGAEPLARVEQVWPKAGSDRRVVFMP
jgi:NAD(P)-dependent dehydrogenase (short-subunit alcohol dehydrogenase family)